MLEVGIRLGNFQYLSDIPVAVRYSAIVLLKVVIISMTTNDGCHL